MFEKQENIETPIASEVIISRHSIRGSGSEYEDISLEGVEKAKKIARGELVPVIEGAEEGSVIFMGGNSTETRTNSTLKVYSNELKDIFKERKDILFFNHDQIKGQSKKSGYLDTARYIKEKAGDNLKAKIIIDLPLTLNNLASKDWFREDGVSVKAEQEALLNRHGKDYSGAVKEWFEHGGFLGGKQILPRPIEVAENYLRAIKRLENFISEFSGKRKLKIVLIGHGFEIDALRVYLSNNRKITPEGFEKIGDKITDTAELSFIEPDNEGNIHLKYRGEKFVLPKTENKEETKQNE